MKINEILFENRVDFLRNKYKNIKNDVFTQLFYIDPTKNKIYLQWIINQYLKDQSGRFMEDWNKLHDDLLVYTKLKAQNKINQKDINQIRSSNELYDLIEPHLNNIVSGKEQKDLHKEEVYKNIKVIYNGPEGKILVPTTEEASCFLGKGTRWCTAARNNNAFEEYKDGPLYIILPNDNTKYQFHLQTAQLMNEKDREVNFEHFNKKYSWVFDKLKFTEEKQIEAVTNVSDTIKYIKNPSEQVQLIAIKKDATILKYIKNPSEQVQLIAIKNYPYAIKYIKNPSEQVQLIAIKNYAFSIEHIKNPSEQVQLMAVKNIGDAIEHIKNPSEKVQLAAVISIGGSIEYIKNPSEKVQLAAVRRDPYAIKYIKNPSKRVQLSAVNKSGNVIEYIKKPDKDVQLAAIRQNRKAIYLIKNSEMAAKEKNNETEF